MRGRDKRRGALVMAAAILVGATWAGASGAAASPNPTRSVAGVAATWHVVPIPDPHHDANLLSISCSSASACTAVGEASIGPPSFPILDERSAGSASGPGAVLRSPLTAGTAGRTFAVAERWNGRSWRVQHLPAIPKTTTVVLFAVSCPTAQSCTAVGDEATNSDTPGTAIAEHWNGTRWSLQQLPRNGPQLLGVSCPSIDWCAAVGTWSKAGLVNQPVADVWTGLRWRSLDMAALRDNEQGTLESVSCVSTRVCTAVGSKFKFTGKPGLVPDTTLVEHWGGGQWHIQASPNVTDQSGLYGADCPSATACAAVGDYLMGMRPVEYRPLIETSNGSSWTYRPTPRREDAGLSAVSCVATADCVAVGEIISPSAHRSIPLVEAGGGASWKMVPTPMVPKEDRGLSAVSCVGDTCMAIGYKGSNGLLAAEL